MCYDAQSVGRWGLVHHIYAEFVDAVFEGVEQHLWLLNMVNVESKQARRQGSLVAAFLSAEGCLPAHGWQFALAVEIARSYLFAEAREPRFAYELLKLLAAERDRELGAIGAIVECHSQSMILNASSSS